MDEYLWSYILKGIQGMPDMRAPSVQDGYIPPAAGLAYARLVGYFEIGKHDEENREGELVLVDKVDLVFELSGPNHQPHKLDDGTLMPHRVTVQETLSFSDRANFFKLFTMMNAAYGGSASHMVLLLSKPFIVEVFHRRSKDGKKVYANLKGPNGYNVRGASVHDPVTGKQSPIDVGPALTDSRAFVWELANKDMWDSIHIPGFYEERRNDKGEVIAPARSKNVLQERIMSAKNWPELAARLGVSPTS
ncbi:hypothetical protein [Paraburkholderia ginsengisoli]|uniref:Uncharacterized protein n=1 Tax=Paraburkholderia ginsengisoli TaxID=311231 RepID=A0A7T4N3E3_9BURK|nr:hypothetical protein [Paraburkholderia ginsengisoli]QQC64493.1 hypothetical protein I6I06_03150 [Paraburkholderia ginsengisoli]